MKNLNMIIWLTQLGYSVAFPLAGFTLAAVWLRQRFQLGVWVLLLGIGIGLVLAIDGFRVSMKAMEQMAKNNRETEEIRYTALPA
jgi:uncharacterized membrane protein